MNRIIENADLLLPHKIVRRTDSPAVQELQQQIANEMLREQPDEQRIVDLLREIAGQLYRQTNAKTQIAAQIARKRAALMHPQDVFNAAYFSESIDAVSLIREAASFCIQKQKPIFAKARINRMEVQRIPKRTVSVIEPQKSILVDKEKYHQKRVAAYCRVPQIPKNSLHPIRTRCAFTRKRSPPTRNGSLPAFMPTKAFPAQGRTNARSSSA